MSQLPLTIPAPPALPLCLLQVEFRGPGQGMTGDWVAAAQDWGRRSRGATVRLASLVEVSRDMCQQAELPVLRESLTSESLCPHKVSVLREFMSSESLCAQRVSVLRQSVSSGSFCPQKVSVLKESLSSESLHPQRVSGRKCGSGFCLESAVEPGNFLSTEWDTRLVWREDCGLGHENFVSRDNLPSPN